MVMVGTPIAGNDMASGGSTLGDILIPVVNKLQDIFNQARLSNCLMAHAVNRTVGAGGFYLYTKGARSALLPDNSAASCQGNVLIVPRVHPGEPSCRQWPRGALLVQRPASILALEREAKPFLPMIALCRLRWT